MIWGKLGRKQQRGEASLIPVRHESWHVGGGGGGVFLLKLNLNLNRRPKHPAHSPDEPTPVDL